MEDIKIKDREDIEVDIEAVVYFTLKEILDKYKGDSEKSKKDKRAMRYLTGVFTKELVVPVRKKTDENYVNHFFFFNVLEICERFAESRISTNEIGCSLLKYRKNKNYKMNLEHLKKCYSEDGDEPGIVWIPLPNGRKRKKQKEKTPEKEVKEKKEENGVMVEFRRVELDKEYVLGKIADYLLLQIKKYWKEVKKKEERNKKLIINLYRDVCVCLAIYELFIREFCEQEEVLYNAYQRFLLEICECLERMAAGDESQEEKEELRKRIEELVCEREQYQLIECIEQHDRMYTAVMKCIAFIELLNMEDRYYITNYKRKIQNAKTTYENLIFDRNGNDSLKPLVIEFFDTLEKEKIFSPLQMEADDSTVRNIMNFLDYIAKNKASYEGEELTKLVWKLAAPVYDRKGCLKKVDISRRDFEKIKVEVYKK